MITAMPSILVVDDDPVSLAFLVAAIERLGCIAIACPSGGDALKAVAAANADLLLLDRHLADSDGPALLALMRQRGITAPAIATSAEIDAAAAANLRESGFVDTLAKPTTLTLLQELLQRHLRVGEAASAVPEPNAVAGALLDDHSALAALGGDRTALKALRGLFARELEALDRDFDVPTLISGGRLHRLRASCGFCGALRLAGATVLLDHALRSGDASAPALVQQFQLACRATRQALAAD